jgi:hypothetical protein
MAITDIITTPFLISLAITLLLIIGFGIFFIQKIEYQNHKITSMVDLVTTMAEEMNVIKGRMFLNHTHAQSQNIIPSFGGSNSNIRLEQNNNSSINDLIEVSDNESDDDNDDNESDGDSVCEDLDNNSSDEDGDDSDSDSDSESESSVKEQIKHISINYKNNEADILDDVKDITDETDIDSGSDNDSNIDLEELESINSDDSIDMDKSIELLEESDIKLENNNISIEKSDENNNLDILKTINISDFDHSDSNNQSIDYKKLPVNQLRNIAIEKGLINNTDSNKLKKNEIIKLLQDK